MKYIPYSIWLIITGVMCLTVFPAMFVYMETSWFEIGDKILKSN
jgi:hypothetical protein